MKTEKTIAGILNATCVILFIIAAGGIEGFVELGIVRFVLIYAFLYAGMAVTFRLGDPLRVRRIRRALGRRPRKRAGRKAHGRGSRDARTTA